jgi:decaprenyl-phosphate phosphoribosyltransferase
MISIVFICFFGALFCSFFLPNKYLITLSIYLFLTVSYSAVIKHKPVVEMIWLSSSFLIRAVAGSTIIESPPTGWFIICVFFGALFVVSAKRSAELKSLEALQTRKVMALYSKNFINTVFSTSLAVCLITYALWAFETHPESVIAQVSILPFACSLYFYAYQCDSENAQHPEDLFFKSRAFLMSVLLTILCLYSVFYL